MKKLLLLLVLLVLIADAEPAPARNVAGHLDHEFGAKGLVLTKLGGIAPDAPSPPDVLLARGPGGGLIAASKHVVVEYLPNGRLNERFGHAGRVLMPAPPGQSLELMGLAIDSHHRILLAGNAWVPGSSSVGPSSIFVSRLLPDGSPDISFGSEGVLLTNLGFPSPQPPESSGPMVPVPPIGGPVVTTTGLAVDDADRLVLTGTWGARLDLCYPFLGYCLGHKAFVARLDQQGAADRSFGDAGVFLSSKQYVDTPLIDGGVLFLGADGCSRCLDQGPTLERITDAALPDSSFRPGDASLPFFGLPAAVRDRQGRILILGSRPQEEPPRVALQRFSSRGELDRRFGSRGSIGFDLPEYSGPPSLAVDGHARPIVATVFSRRRHDYLFLSRRTRLGKTDPTFGMRGSTSTALPLGIALPQVMVDGSGKILVAAGVIDGDRYGLLVARYVNSP